jgi:hypothetical protein
MSALVSQVNRQLARFLGIRITRAEDLNTLISQFDLANRDRRMLAEQLEILRSMAKSLTNSPLAIRRICSMARLLRPQRAQGYGKMRLGGPHDGGYICLDDFVGIVAALSLGVGDDVSWDTDVANRGIIVHQYDHTVASAPAAHPNFRFNQRKIGPVANDDSESIESVLGRSSLMEPATVLLKIDIEHDEWPVFDAASASVLGKFAQIVCEFHGFDQVADDKWFERAYSVLEKLTKSFAVVHVHANNAAPMLAIGNLLFPQLLEVTFASRARYSFSDASEVFPGELDSPNLTSGRDYNLGNFIYPVHS